MEREFEHLGGLLDFESRGNNYSYSLLRSLLRSTLHPAPHATPPARPHRTAQPRMHSPLNDLCVTLCPCSIMPRPRGARARTPQTTPTATPPLSPATGWCLDPDERALSLSSIAFARPTHANVQAQCWPLCSMRRMPQGAPV